MKKNSVYIKHHLLNSEGYREILIFLPFRESRFNTLNREWATSKINAEISMHVPSRPGKPHIPGGWLD